MVLPNRTRVLPSSRGGQLSSYSTSSMLIVLGLCGASFFAGTLWTMHANILGWHVDCDKHPGIPSSQDIEALVQRRVMEVLQEQSGDHAIVPPAALDSMSPRFPPEMKRFAIGMARTDKADFTQLLDIGVPVDVAKEGDTNVLLLYARHGALPTKRSQVQSSGPIPLLSSADALEHCDHVHVVMTDHSASRNQCVALVPQYESFHIQNWMRVSDVGPVDTKLPLRLVSRGYQNNGRQQFLPPKPTQTQQLWDMLGPYIRDMKEVLAELKPLATMVAKDNTIIVMVCNFGQSELLVNFVCSSRARGLDISQVLVFTTDQETKDLAEGLGLVAFYDQKNFGNMPTEAAQSYGDRKFVAMMMAKVFCVQMISMLGYDILFQDVDIVWYQHPLQYFHNRSSSIRNFDLYFQDDGARSTRYAPYSANSGFYYVRHNARTRYFFTALLHAGDLILRTDSHQQALVALLSEHSSLYGLRVKVLSRDLDEFPGGYHYHQKSGKYMKQFFANETHPYMFHMSWTENKDNKLLFLRQMGEWHVHDACISQRADMVLAATNATHLSAACCSAEPLISCHYRDKPSKIPCQNSPPIDNGRKSFW